MFSLFRLAILALILAIAPTIYNTARADHAHVPEKNANVLGMVTGPQTGTYRAFGNDIARISSAENIYMDVKSSNGSVENIKRITQMRENAGLGIVQSDVLGFLQRSRNAESQKVAKQLRMMFPFYREEIHVLARKDIKSFADLHGKRVVIGQRGSGNMLTAMNLMTLMGIQPVEYIQIAPAEGAVAVLADEADALIFTGGKPVPLFKNMENIQHVNGGRNAHLLDAVHLLPLNDPRLLKEYEPAMIAADDYQFVRQDTPTISVRAVLISYDFSSKQNAYYKERCDQLAHIGHAIRSHLSTLQDTGHPKWGEVDLDRSVGIWQRDECAWSPISSTKSTKKPHGDSPLERDLLNVIQGE